MADVQPTGGFVPLRYDNVTLEADVLTDDNGIIKLDDGLETAVMISLFTDRLAEDGDDYQRGVAGGRRGYWATFWRTMTKNGALACGYLIERSGPIKACCKLLTTHASPCSG